MNNMGAELFELSWVQAIVMFFSYFGWALFVTGLVVAVFDVAASGDVAGAIEGTWSDARGQIKQVVNNVVFPVIDLILAVFLFVKIGMTYFDYRKTGQFEWAAPAILFACLVFTLSAPLYIWEIIV